MEPPPAFAEPKRRDKSDIYDPVSQERTQRLMKAHKEGGKAAFDREWDAIFHPKTEKQT